MGKNPRRYFGERFSDYPPVTENVCRPTYNEVLFSCVCNGDDEGKIQHGGTRYYIVY